MSPAFAVRVRTTAIGFAALALGAGLLATAATATPQQASAADRPFPDRIELPDGFQPEGIALGPGPVAWFGSRVDGDIYEVDLRTGKGEVISEGPGTSSVGMESDRRRRLWVAGGAAGDARVVDSRSGGILASYQLSTATSFINDVILKERAAWFTNSAEATLYRVPRDRKGGPGNPAGLRAVPLTGDWVQGEGFGANGITTGPKGHRLLVVNSGTGLLYRVQTDGTASEVDLGGYLLTNGDGMLRHGRTLYVVQNRLNKIAVLRLNRTGSRAKLVRTITSPDFDVPTTVASFGPWLYLPNGRFNTTPTADTEYWVTRVRRIGGGSPHH